MTIDSLAAARQSLAVAEDRLDALRAATESFFAGHPYRIRVAPHGRLPEYTEFRFRLDRSVPRRIQRLARRTAKAMSRALRQLDDAGHGPAQRLDTLEQICRLSRWRFIVPEVRAKSVLAVDGLHPARSATLHAPVWHPASREVTLLLKDPDEVFKGGIHADFYFAFAGSPTLRSQSVVTVLQGLLNRVEEIFAEADPSAVPVAAPASASRESATG